MLYLIKDVVTDIFNYQKITTVKIAMTEEDVLTFLSNPENLKQFKGDIKIDKVVL